MYCQTIVHTSTQRNPWICARTQENHCLTWIQVLLVQTPTANSVEKGFPFSFWTAATFPTSKPCKSSAGSSAPGTTSSGTVCWAPTGGPPSVGHYPWLLPPSFSAHRCHLNNRRGETSRCDSWGSGIIPLCRAVAEFPGSGWSSWRRSWPPWRRTWRITSPFSRIFAIPLHSRLCLLKFLIFKHFLFIFIHFIIL